jgi:hypothetical protein
VGEGDKAIRVELRMLGGNLVLLCEETFVPLLTALADVPGLEIVNDSEDIDHSFLLQTTVVRNFSQNLQLLWRLLSHGEDIQRENKE